MVYYGAYRPDLFANDLREEDCLSPESVRHVEWRCCSGLLNRQDVRSMLHRESNLDNHCVDMREWPSLADAAKAPARRIMPGARAPPAPAPAVTRRGFGVEPRVAEDPELVVLDWGLRRPDETPPPKQQQRAHTMSPEQRPRFGDLTAVPRKPPLVRAMLDDSPGLHAMPIKATESNTERVKHATKRGVEPTPVIRKGRFRHGSPERVSVRGSAQEDPLPAPALASQTGNRRPTQFKPLTQSLSIAEANALEQYVTHTTAQIAEGAPK